LTGTQKAEICRLKQKGVSQVKLAERFGVAEATILGIICEKERWLSLDSDSKNSFLKRQRTGKFPLLEEAVALRVSRANYKKFFSEDRINAFNAFLEFGSDPPEPINIKDAISFTATAWSKVTPRTIRNCWWKTGILPQDFLSELFPFEGPDQINESIITSEIENLILHLPLDQPMNAEEYMTVDNNLITNEMPTDEMIIEAVKNHKCIEPEDEVTTKPIFFIQALGFMNGILLFLKQQPDGTFNVDDSLIRNLGKLKKEVKLKHITSHRQSTLDSFILDTN
ncbi:520_t:CDS:2, partial [Gigaspora rosea]